MLLQPRGQCLPTPGNERPHDPPVATPDTSGVCGVWWDSQDWPTVGPKYFARGTRTPLDFSTCAVVGSSYMMKRSGFGAQIDAHTAVFRFNEAPSGGLYAPRKPPAVLERCPTPAVSRRVSGVRV
jgi:hypothetical protein